MNSICLVVPCFNEEKRLPLEQFKNTTNINFIFVDDGSTDQTGSMLKNLAEKSSHVKVLSHAQNAGKAQAVLTGLMEAIKETEYQWVGFWDADMATPLEAVKDFFLYKEVFFTNEQVDVLMGSRIKKVDSQIDRKLSRHLIGRVIITICSLFLKPFPFYDTQCGAKLFKNSQQFKAALPEKFQSRWLFDIELLILLQRQNTHIVEVPLRKWTDVKGSKISFFKDAPGVLRELISLIFHYRN